MAWKVEIFGNMKLPWKDTNEENCGSLFLSILRVWLNFIKKSVDSKEKKKERRYKKFLQTNNWNNIFKLFKLIIKTPLHQILLNFFQNRIWLKETIRRNMNEIIYYYLFVFLKKKISIYSNDIRQLYVVLTITIRLKIY